MTLNDFIEKLNKIKNEAPENGALPVYAVEGSSGTTSKVGYPSVQNVDPDDSEVYVSWRTTGSRRANGTFRSTSAADMQLIQEKLGTPRAWIVIRGERRISFKTERAARAYMRAYEAAIGAGSDCRRPT